MADTSYLKREVEPYLINWVSRRLGVGLEKRTIDVGKTYAGDPVRFEFDGVSADKTVGVCISASCSYKTGQMRKLFMDASLLNRVPHFKRRIMVFIRGHIWEGFRNQCDGLVDLKNIEVMVCDDMPAAMSARVDEIYRESAQEVGDKHGRGTGIPGKRSGASGQRQRSMPHPVPVCGEDTPKTLTRLSKRHTGRSPYWWDIAPNLAAKLENYSYVAFTKKDSSERCVVPVATLRWLLAPHRRTTRGAGNWGVRVLKGHESELAFEPPKGGQWVFLPVTWLAEHED